MHTTSVLATRGRWREPYGEHGDPPHGSRSPFLEASKLSNMFILWMSYVRVVLGSKVRFLLIVFKANLKASSSAPEGPLSMDSNIPPVRSERKQ